MFYDINLPLGKCLLHWLIQTTVCRYIDNGVHFKVSKHVVFKDVLSTNQPQSATNIYIHPTFMKRSKSTCKRLTFGLREVDQPSLETGILQYIVLKFSKWLLHWLDQRTNLKVYKQPKQYLTKLFHPICIRFLHPPLPVSQIASFTTYNIQIFHYINGCCVQQCTQVYHNYARNWINHLWCCCKMIHACSLTVKNIYATGSPLNIYACTVVRGGGEIS